MEITSILITVKLSIERKTLIMPTLKRIWYPGAIYHITSRGNRKDKIFQDSNDFTHYLDLLKDTLEYFKNDKYKILSYCLMSNHIHMLIEADKMPLGQFMCKLNSKYAMYYNKKYNYTGHLFEGRYFAKLMKSNLQIFEASKYIHLNPVKAKIVKKPEQYKWSSYSMYIGNRKEKLIYSKLLLSYFRTKKLYKEYVEYTPGV